MPAFFDFAETAIFNQPTFAPESMCLAAAGKRVGADKCPVFLVGRVIGVTGMNGTAPKWEIPFMTKRLSSLLQCRPAG